MENLPEILYVINFTSHYRANRLIHRLTSSFPKFYYPDILPGYRFLAVEKSKQIRFQFLHFQLIIMDLPALFDVIYTQETFHLVLTSSLQICHHFILSC